MKNFLAEINERARSPFIYSFLIAWLIFNWKIPISLFFEDVKELEALGYHSHLQFIQAKLNWNNSFLHPFYSALIYTFGFPFVKNGISIFNGWIQSWGNSYTLKASRKGKISVEKYIELKDNYAKQLSLLEETVKKESNFLIENNNLKRHIKELKSHNAIIEESKDSMILDGFWNYSYFNEVTKKKESGYLRIKNGEIYQSDATKILHSMNISKIELFNFVKSNNSVRMTINPRTYPNSLNTPLIHNQVNYFDLSLSPEKDIMTGQFGNQLNNNITFTKFD